MNLEMEKHVNFNNIFIFIFEKSLDFDYKNGLSFTFFG
jgi:hypothetical protein